MRDNQRLPWESQSCSLCATAHWGDQGRCSLCVNEWIRVSIATIQPYPPFTFQELIPARNPLLYAAIKLIPTKTAIRKSPSPRSLEIFLEMALKEATIILEHPHTRIERWPASDENGLVIVEPQYKSANSLSKSGADDV